MNLEQARDCVEKTFRHKFDEDRFLFFIRNLVNHLDETKRAQFSGNYIKRAFAEQVGHYLRLGTYSDPRGEFVDVLVIHLRKETTLARGRVTLRNFVADYLDSGHGKNKAAVIAAFVSPADDDWRFSFVKLDFTFEKTELGLVTERRMLTPARRYSYLVGANENCHTAQKQFIDLLTTDIADPTVAALEAAFGVEKVTKEFYEHYRILFEKTSDALKTYLANDPRIENHFAERGIEPDDFTKKLLGQIVFLYFLQKKGWFGVERGQPWGSGNKGFIRHLFTERAHFAHLVARKSKRDSNFFNDILEPLFYDALARPRVEDDHYYPSFDCRIPFLNGGLFEPLYGYRWDDTEILLSDTLFSNDEESNDGDKGTGILDVFDRYNFTVNEAEPLEKEVAVDPEMLGKVFENLLPENIRHSSGTYYTPRVIVHYMCQQALLHYLTVRAPEVPQDELARFLHLAERFADFEATDTKAHADKRLPPTVATNDQLLDKLLHDVTVCDPAIGSGAFPVGMMHEIVRARLALTNSLEKKGKGKVLDGGKPRTAYGLKRHAIHHSLYGVDIDPGAVEIAKLRLWLSMVVDEDDIRDIQPLPNLDYKIMQGNSLLDEFEGIRLFDEKVLRQPDESRVQEAAELKEKIRVLQATAIRAHADGRQGAALKHSAERDITRLKKSVDRLLHNAPHEELELNSQESWQRLARLQLLHANFFKESNRQKKEEMRSELGRLEWDFMCATLREQAREQALAELERAGAKHRKPFFLWWLHFSEIKQRNGGFDIVIANPPFVRMELIMDDKPALKRRFPHLYAGRADLYVYFYGLGMHILRDGGCLTFISSNSYLNSKFGEKLRQHFLDTVTIRTLIDFAETKVFDAVVEPAIIVMDKMKTEKANVSIVKWQQDRPLDELAEVAMQAVTISQSSFTAEPWQLVGGDTARILAEMRHSRMSLAEHPEWKPLRGVVTGLNEAFVIDGAKRAKLLRDNPESAEIIHPFLRGRDIAKWNTTFGDAYIIYTYHGIDLSRFEAIEAHLRPFKKALEGRATEQKWYELQQPQMAYESFFRGPKLVYQEINRTDAFAYDEGKPTGMFVNNKVFFIPDAPKALLAFMNSSVASFFIHTLSGVPRGGFLALQINLINPLPIPNWTDKELRVLDVLGDYVVWLRRNCVTNGEVPVSTSGALLAGYFEQWVNALVYELFFPKSLHAAGLRFFQLAEAANLVPLTQMKPGTELACLRNKFDELYIPDHTLRQSLFALDSIEEVRIIEGKV